MHNLVDIGTPEVKAVYSGPEFQLWELLMGEQIHIGGLASSQDLANSAAVAGCRAAVDLCCCTGAGCRFLARLAGVEQVTGVDMTAAMISLGRERMAAQGCADRVTLVEAEACATGLPDGSADLVWGEDAWCYVPDKAALAREAARLLQSGGTVAFTDWCEAEPMAEEEAERFLRFMKFPSLATRADWVALLGAAGLEVRVERDTGRYLPAVELYLQMVAQQLGYDALRIVGFDTTLLAAIAAELAFVRDLARAGKLEQALIVARKP